MNYMRMVYFAIAQSVLEYGIIAWGGTYSKTISPLTNLQNKIVKLCLKKTRFYSTTQAFLDFDVMTTRQRYTVTLLNFVFRNLSKFSLQATHRLTRRLLDRPLMVPLYRKTLCQKHANYLGPKMYNNLESDFKNLLSRANYKIKIKQYVILNRNIYNNCFA